MILEILVFVAGGAIGYIIGAKKSAKLITALKVDVAGLIARIEGKKPPTGLTGPTGPTGP